MGTYIDGKRIFREIRHEDLAGSYIDLTETTPPATPLANILRLYVEDVKGFSFFSFVDDTGMIRKLVRDSVFVGKASETIAIGQVVYASGSSGNVPTLNLARSNSLTTMPAIGIAVENIANGAFGRIMQVGLLEHINTNAFAEGNVLFVDAATAGALTATAPLYPNIRQEMGTVLVKSIGAGTMQCIARSMVYEPYIDAAGLLNTSYTNVTGTSQTATINMGYIANNAALVTITLPATAAVGTSVAIVGSGAGGWKLAQNASQLVNFVSLTTTTGVTGYLASTVRYDCVKVRCVVANTTWVVESAAGNLTVV